MKTKLQASIEAGLNTKGQGRYFDKDGERIGLGTWARLTEDQKYKVIARTRIGKRTVSTVWLGIDSATSGKIPMIFETMVFPECEDWTRYATLVQAVKGHMATVARMRKP